MAFSIVQHAQTLSNANADTLTFSISATASGSSLAVITGVESGGGRTIDHVSDNQSGTWAQCPGASVTTLANMDTWFRTTAAAGVTSVTVTFQGGAGTYFKYGFIWEIGGMSGMTKDSANTANTSASGGIATGGAVTTTHNDTVIIASCGPAVNDVTANPHSGNVFTAGGDINAHGGAGCSYIASATGTYTPAWDVSSGGFISVTAAFYDVPPAASTFPALMVGM